MASDLKNLKGRGYTLATVKYDNHTSSGKRTHRVTWFDYADPWKELAKSNTLESTWNSPNRILGRHTKPFKVEEKAVDSGSGSVQIKWNVWDDADKLTNLQVELYSVMRAEYRYCESLGYKKLMSKYFYVRNIGGRFIPIENCGIDNFFKKGSQYVVCESKFTRNEGKFATWKSNHENVWELMGKYKAGGKPCRQMSWQWIADRATLAADKPAGMRGASAAKRAAILADVNEVKDACVDRDVTRVVNVYGSANVPIYPGRYKFMCGEGAKVSKNELHLQWDLGITDSEFVELGAAFDQWAAKNK